MKLKMYVRIQCPWTEGEDSGKTRGDITTMEENEFTWKVILKWATASEATHFPGAKFPIVKANTGNQLYLCVYCIYIYTYIASYICIYTYI